MSTRIKDIREKLIPILENWRYEDYEIVLEGTDVTKYVPHALTTFIDPNDGMEGVFVPSYGYSVDNETKKIYFWTSY